MRARNIKPGFFTSDQVAENDFAGRLLFIGMWLMADCNGNLEYRPMKIKATIFPLDNVDVKKLTINLEKSGLIKSYSADGKSYINIPKFLKHQNPHKNERDKGGIFPEYKTNAEEPHCIAQSRIIQNNPDKSGKIQSDPADSLFLNPDSLILNPDSNTPKPPKGDVIEIPENLNNQNFLEAWEEWQTHRKEIRKKLTPTTAKAQIKKLATMGAEGAAKAIRFSIEKGWTGIFADQGKEPQKEKPTPKGEPIPSREPLYNPFTDPNFGKSTSGNVKTIELKEGNYERL